MLPTLTAWLRHVVLLLTLAVPPSLRAQAFTPDAVRGAGSLVTLTVGGVSHVLPLPPTVRVDMDTVTVLDAREVGGAKYLLLSVNGPSKRKGYGSGECGVGYETAIVWLRLRSWTPVQSQSALVESCWQNRIMEETLVWVGDTGIVTWQQMGKEAARYEVRYDRAAPRRGVVTVRLGK